MHIVIVHFHLNRGGVTRVIENHLRALATLTGEKAPTHVTIVYGGRATAWHQAITDDLPFECTTAVVPELDYDDESSREHGSKPTADKLLREIQSALDRSHCVKDTTVLHIHNYCLGKNAALPWVIAQLANDGWGVLLHIHDFSEDLRPANYRHMLECAGSVDNLHEELYPQATNIHYAVLNYRDHGLLGRAGIASDRLHLLPNAVDTKQRPPCAQQAEQAKRKLADKFDITNDRMYVLYPVRAIRRKNLGEFLLWSLLVDQATFAVTLAPLNPRELPTYQAWQSLAESLRLSVLFDVGGEHELGLDENYAAADAIISTSVAEGFGLVFLEATLAGRHLVGRSLPGVIDDFQNAGMEFPGLSESLKMPAEWVDVDELRRKHITLSIDLRASFGMPPLEPGEIGRTVEQNFAGDTIDFGRLDSQMQRDILCRVSSEAELGQVLRELNPVATTVGKAASTSYQLCFEANRQVIEQRFSLEVIGDTLSRLYNAVLGSERGRIESHPSIARSILDSFVRPSELFPIRLQP